MKDFWKRRRNKRIAASALAVIMAGFLVWGIFPWQAAATENTVADDVTANNWSDEFAADKTTKNIGRIWTDKSVATGTDGITLKTSEGAVWKTITPGNKSYDKSSKSDFVVGLSALSSTAKILGETTEPLDIVLVLDVSGSMKNSNKMTTLQSAVNNFIDKSAEENDKRSDKNKRSRISLVKFAGDNNKTVGNDTYQGNRELYNYTQIVRGYKAYTSEDKQELKGIVNTFKPGGATSADYAMNHAQTLVSQSKTDEKNNPDRKNVKRIVIFFTDGQPNHGNGFSKDVANDAIIAAKSMKSDASIYTVGVFNEADSSITGHTGGGKWTDKEKFNAYMHAMSSNYPDANAYDDLGTRAKDSKDEDTQFYKSATNAADLNSIFTSIAEEIVASAQVPTEVEQGKHESKTGYITLVDQLGDYMQVDDMNVLAYANDTSKYTDKKESKSEETGITTITYTYKKEIPNTNHVYPTGNLEDLIVKVEKSSDEKTGDRVTLQIPANLIPLKYYEIDKDGKMTIDWTYPMRLFYDVSLKDGVADKIENPDAALQEYIKANKDDEGQVHFYTNQYSKDGNSETIGAYAHFVPAKTNDFYYFQNDEVLYLDEDCKQPTTDAIDKSGNTTYYYQRDYYELGVDGKAISKVNTVKIPGNSNLLLEDYAVKNTKTGEYYIPAGTPRTTSLSYFTEDKAEGANKTNTATTSIKPVWEGNFQGKTVTTYLGNNGRMTFDLPGELDITKTVNAAEGHAVPDSLKDKEFEYTLALTAKEGSTLKDEYTAQKYNGAEADGDAFKIKPGGTFTLKDGQTLKIYGLAAGTDYTVTETKADHFTASVTQNNAGDNAAKGTNDNGGVFAKGTITGHDTTVVNYTNTYKAAPGTLDGSNAFKVHKDFVTPKENSKDEYTSAWDIDYLKESEFTFYLTADNIDTPMPSDAQTLEGTKSSIRRVNSKSTINQTFGDITYTKPGIYNYRITERNPGTAGKPGVSYSSAGYTVTVTVTDDNGTLKATAVMKKIRNDGGTELTEAATVEDNTAVFRNIYETNKQAVTAEAQKEFTDHTGSKTLKDGDYTFRITAIDGAPLSNGQKSIEVPNTGIGVKFTSKVFTIADAANATKDKPITYKYWMEEVMPSGANAGNHYTVNGITYDPTKYKIRLNIYVETVDGKDTVIVDRTYLNEDETEIATPVPVFHNSYRAGAVTLAGDTALIGDKILTGRDMKDGERFDFTLAAGDDNTAKAIKDKIVTIAENGSTASATKAQPTFKFGGVTFTKEGTYTFDIKETVSDQKAGGMTYDRHTTKATVVVTDDNGQLKATVTYDNGTVSDATDKAVFKNIYKASSTYGGLQVEKVLNGRTMEAGEFNFTITPGEDAPAISDGEKSFANASRRGSGEADIMKKLQNLTFTEKNAGKTYTYTVKETQEPPLSGVKYDLKQYVVEITPVDNGDGTMHTVTKIIEGDQETTYDSSAENAGTPTVRFTNSYEAAQTDPVSITDGFNKVLTGRDWNNNDSFTFKLSSETEDAPMPEKTNVTVTQNDVKNGKAPINFGNIIFEKAGTYQYTIAEEKPDPVGAGMVYDTATRTITVTVTDDGSGKLTAGATVVTGSKTFTNEYKTEDLKLDEACGIKVTKKLIGHDMAKDQFEFSIKAADKASADKLKIAEGDGATFGSQKADDGVIATLLDSLQMTLTQSDIGKTYSYTFAETKGSDKGYTYDENTYKLDITTTDAGDGTLTATVVLTNTKTNKELFRKTVSKKDPALGEKGVNIDFVNRYDGSTDVEGGTKATIKADKTLNGRKLKAGEFSFTLATRPSTGSTNALETKTNDANGNIAFSALSYRTSNNAAGNGTILSDAVRAGYATKSTNDQGQAVYTLNYRVYENTTPLPAGVTGGTTSFDFTVTVTDNGDGTLTAVTNYPEGKDKFGFVNTYGADSISVDIKGSKVLSHTDGLSPADITGKFSFKLEAVTDGAPMPKKGTVTNDAAGNIDFGNVTFDLDLLQDVNSVSDADQSGDVEQPGEVDKSRTKIFEYKVTETGSAAGVTNDSAKTKIFKLTLTDDGNGNLTITSDPKEGPKFTFTNTYTVGKLPSSITDQINIDKDLTGRDLKKGEFSFELLENGKVVAEGTNDASGNVTFDKTTYTEPGTHTYTVREVNNGLGGVTYDDQTYTVHTTITDNGDGTLKAKHEAFAVIDDKELASVDKITFNNKYEAKGTTASIGAVKRLTGKDLKDGQFTFQLKDESGKVIDEAKNDKTGAISFKALEFDKAGTYHYTVSEVNDKQKEIKYDSSEKAVTITIKDSTNGYLEAQIDSEDQMIFTNAYEAAGGNGGIGGHGTKTGDNFNLLIPILLMLAAAAGGGALFIRRRNHR